MRAKKLPIGTNNMAETQVTMLAIQWGVKLGIQNLYLEGDSLIIINVIVKGEAQAWHLNKYIFTILNIFKILNNYCITHVQREGNEVADVLSKWVLSFDDEDEVRVEDYKDTKNDDVEGGDYNNAGNDNYGSTRSNV